MYNSGQKRITVIFGILLAVLMVSGCAVKHSDVLVFGTNTNYGLTVAMTMPENTPHLNIGYKRQEAVWMPLAINADKSAIAGKIKEGSEANDIKYMGKEHVGGKVIKEDTYSVLASFGSKAGGGQGNVSSGIAQYFATGVAAQQLASLGGASLVNASDENLVPTAAAVRAANAPFVVARGKEFLEIPLQERVNIIVNKIKVLEDAKAKQLAMAPPAAEQKYIDYVDSDIDPAPHIRGTDPAKARKVLKYLSSNMIRSDANLDAWEKALGIVSN
ncbi:MAG: hypothetical protein GY777_26430 [Candidatus Brocadiaceae bacterium]|nr:hypothetical protein [Candidatus Brocadiaceae bacterium]